MQEYGFVFSAGPRSKLSHPRGTSRRGCLRVARKRRTGLTRISSWARLSPLERVFMGVFPSWPDLYTMDSVAEQMCGK